MARQKGANNFAGTLEILAAAPLDARSVVDTKAELTTSGNFPYPYVGMEVYVKSEGKKYTLTAADPTVAANWVENGGKEETAEMSLTDFDALTPAEKNNGKAYFIPDAATTDSYIAHTGFTPVGTVISVMGNSAPTHYLACNGQTVNIADYPELAAYFEAQFGTKNKFGGDGTTTFGIPDLRGEFLRGTGTNGHDAVVTQGLSVPCGNGSSVGTHQNPTLLTQPTVQVSSDGTKGTFGNFSTTDGKYRSISNYDSADSGSTIKAVWAAQNIATSTTSTTCAMVSSRPTNTSVLYCIATKDIYVDARYDYSTDEKVVGTWIDGKPIYQKTVVVDLSNIAQPAADRTFTNLATLPQQIDKAFMLNGFIEFISSGAYRALPTSGVTGTDMYYLVNLNKTATGQWYINVLNNGTTWFRSALGTDANAYFTIQYTKTTD